MSKFQITENKNIVKLNLHHQEGTVFNYTYVFKINETTFKVIVYYSKHYDLNAFTITDVLTLNNKIEIYENDKLIYQLFYSGFPGFCYSAIFYNIYHLNLQFDQFEKNKKEFTKLFFDIMFELFYNKLNPILHYKRKTIIISDIVKNPKFEYLFDLSVLNHENITLGINPNSDNAVKLVKIELE